MDYSEQDANDIIAKFGLNPSLKRSWQNRNRIPAKYADPDFKPRTAPQGADLVHQERLLAAYTGAEGLNMKEICRAAEVPYAQWVEATRKTGDKQRVLLDPESARQVEKEVNDLRQELEGVVSAIPMGSSYTDEQKQQLNEVLLDSRIRRRPLLTTTNVIVYERHVQRNRPGATIQIPFENLEASVLLESLNKFVIQLTL